MYEANTKIGSNLVRDGGVEGNSDLKMKRNHLFNFCMKKLSFLIILFLFSCSDIETSKEKSELNRCINANISIIENSNMERLLEFPGVLELPVKLDIDYIKSTFSELELEISKKKIIDNFSNKNAEEYIKFLQEEEILAENLIINLDD